MVKVIQNHHLIYENKEHKQEEVVEPVFKGEHEILSKMAWYTRKKVSKGFIKSLKLFILLNEDRAEDPNCKHGFIVGNTYINEKAEFKYCIGCGKKIEIKDGED